MKRGPDPLAVALLALAALVAWIIWSLRPSEWLP